MYWSGSWGYIFPDCPIDEAIRVCINPVENSVVATLEKHMVRRAILEEVNFNNILFSNLE